MGEKYIKENEDGEEHLYEEGISGDRDLGKLYDNGISGTKKTRSSEGAEVGKRRDFSPPNYRGEGRLGGQKGRWEKKSGDTGYRFYPGESRKSSGSGSSSGSSSYESSGSGGGGGGGSSRGGGDGGASARARAKALAEQKRIAEAKRIAKAKRVAEQKRIAEQKRVAKAKQLKIQRALEVQKKLQASDIFSRNTYNPQTGVYRDKSGQGISTATQPAGSRTIKTSSDFFKTTPTPKRTSSYTPPPKVNMRLSDFNRKWKSSVVDETFVGLDSNKLIDLDKKYSDLIKDDKFIGTNAQYKSYLKDVNSNKKINIKAEKDFKQYQKDFKDVQEGRSKGLDLSSGESIQDYLKDKPKGYDYSLKPTKLTTPPKDIIFIKPSEMEDFQNVRGYSDFAVTDFTKTTKGEGTGKQMESLSDFTDSLDQGSYAISLEGDTSKVKKIGVSKKIIPKTKEGEIYNPITGMFISESPTGTGATGITRQPTAQEQKDISRAEALGTYAPLPEGIKPITTAEKIIRTGIDFARTDITTPIYVKEEGKIIKKEVKASIIKEFGEEQLAKEDLTFGEKLLYTPASKMPTTYGDLAVLGTAGYLAPTLTVIGTGAMLYSPSIKKGLVEGGKKVEQAGKFLQSIPDTEIKGITVTDDKLLTNLGLITDVTGKAIQGASSLVPEKPTDVLAFALFEKALTSKALPKIVKSVGLKGLGGYEIYGGITDTGLTPEERYGKFLIGGLAGLGSFQEDVILTRKIKGRLFKDFKKTKPDEFGIKTTELNLGKTDIKISPKGKVIMELK